MFLKNIDTGAIGEFETPQGDDWISVTEEEIDAIELEKEKKLYLPSRQAYLQSTNDAVLEAFETSTSVDPTILSRRSQARSDIIGIMAAITLEEVDAYPINF